MSSIIALACAFLTGLAGLVGFGLNPIGFTVALIGYVLVATFVNALLKERLP